MGFLQHNVDNGIKVNRIDSKVNWEKVNPILAKGEIVIEHDNNSFRLKCGDGKTKYKDLNYVS